MVQGGNPPMRPDQALQPQSRAGVGPAPQNFVFGRVIVIPGTAGGVFIYFPSPGPGNLIGSWTAIAGTDPYRNAYPAGINVTSGVLSNVVLSSLSETMNPGPFLLDAPGDIAIQVFTVAGSNNFTAPAGVTSVTAFVQGPGGAGGVGAVGGFGGGGGGGGGFTSAVVAVTPANVYHPIVGVSGSASVFAGDTQTLTANSGGAGGAGTSAPGAGGVAGTSTGGTPVSNNFFGGKGGSAGTSGNSGGGGGGGGASSSQSGNQGQPGGPGPAGLGGAGASAAPGEFPGGAGGAGGVHATGVGVNGSLFGGGGGGGGDGGAHAGGTGANGRVILIYSTATLSTFVAMATASGTDPNTGSIFNAGITTYDPVFGDTARFFGATAVIGGSAVWNLTGASLAVVTLGSGLRVKEGANAKQGLTAAMAAGTLLVANTAITASSRLLLTRQAGGANPGAVYESARVAGTSFTVTSTNGADTGQVAFEIFEPG